MSAAPSDTASRLKGAFTALVTPFKEGKVDEAALGEMVEFQVSSGIDGLVPVGTTGESPTLSYEEHNRVVRVVVEAARGRVPVLAGTGANSTREALELSREAERAGADALLIVSPYYNRPTQRGLEMHFAAILDAVKIPVVAYNIPSRTGVNIEPETMAALARHPRFVGDKEAAGSTDQASRILELCGPDFILLSGDDSMTLPFMSVGGRGVISVVSNIVPAETVAMVRAFAAGRTAEALAMHRRLFPLVKAVFVETNPVPIKTALGILGRCSPELRLPMAPMEPSNAEKLKAAMRAFGLKVQ